MPSKVFLDSLAHYMTLSHLHDSLARAGCASPTCSPIQAAPDDQGQDSRPWPAGLDWPSIPTQSGEEATSGGQARPGQASQGQQGQVTSRRRCNRSRNRGVDLNGHPRRFIAAERGEQIAKNFRKTRKMTSLATPPRRKSSVPRAGAHRNGLRDVEEARTSPLQPPESRRLDAPIRYFLREVLVFCGKFWYRSAIIKRQKH